MLINICVHFYATKSIYLHKTETTMFAKTPTHRLAICWWIFAHNVIPTICSSLNDCDTCFHLLRICLRVKEDTSQQYHRFELYFFIMRNLPSQRIFLQGEYFPGLFVLLTVQCWHNHQQKGVWDRNSCTWQWHAAALHKIMHSKILANQRARICLEGGWFQKVPFSSLAAYFSKFLYFLSLSLSVFDDPDRQIFTKLKIVAENIYK